MLHELLTLTRPLYVVDTETSGTNTETDRIVECGFQQWDPTGLIRVWRSLINPGIPIPHAATYGDGAKYSGHGITDDMVQGRPFFKQIAASLAGGLTNCDFAGKNVRFDLKIIAAEMQRAGVPWSYAGARIIDADRLEALAVPRRLADLYRKYMGQEHEGAHGAISDVRASTKVIIMQLATYDSLPRDLDALHALSWPGWLCADGSFRVINGVPTIAFGKYRGKPMRDVPIDYYDYILRQDFPEDVKALARAAKLGQYPS